MKLHSILYGISFVSGLLAYAGIGGALEHGTGWLTCSALAAVCVVSVVWGLYEDGKLRVRKNPAERQLRQGKTKNTQVHYSTEREIWKWKI